MSAFTKYNIAAAYLITYHIGFWRALLISEWRTMSNHYKPPLVATLEILESPNWHNVMTSFGIRLIVKQ